MRPEQLLGLCSEQQLPDDLPQRRSLGRREALGEALRLSLGAVPRDGDKPERHQSSSAHRPSSQETRLTTSAPSTAAPNDCTVKPGTSQAANANASPLTTK